MNSSSNGQKTDKKFNWFSLFLWIAIALFLRWQVIEPRWIPSGSMLPTLEIRDKLLIEKVTPRIQRIERKHPLLGTIVVFHPPKQLKDLGYDDNSALIKRVVGLPGDQIEIHDGALIRNGQEVIEPWRKSPINYEMEIVTIPQNAIWVLGDNRNNSLDSHYWGALPEREIIGTAIWRYWPITKFGPIRFPTHKTIEHKDLIAIRS